MPSLENNKAERIVFEKYTARGYDCLKRGYPDFCFFNENEVFFIEVKRKQKNPTKNMGLSTDQMKMIEIFKKIGLDVRVEYVDCNRPKGRKEIIRNKRIESFDPFSEFWKKKGIEVFQLTPYQFRMEGHGLKIDYYPTSGKYFSLNTRQWGYCAAHDIISLFPAKV